MTQEEKDLLIKDLCTRLPYGVIIQIKDWVVLNEELRIGHINRLQINDVEIKPYLFPMSSMAEEQLFDVQDILGKNEIKIEDDLIRIVDSDRNIFSFSEILTLLEWFYKNHFDINNLIPAGLAIDATGLNIY